MKTLRIETVWNDSKTGKVDVFATRTDASLIEDRHVSATIPRDQFPDKLWEYLGRALAVQLRDEAHDRELHALAIQGGDTLTYDDDDLAKLGADPEF